MPSCAPRYTFKDGRIKNVERGWVSGTCDQKCIHWRACKMEINGGSDTVLPVMLERQAKVLSETQYERDQEPI